MDDVPSYLGNYEAVLQAFGYWPSFHDAHVVRFLHDRTGEGAVELTVHDSRPTSEVDAHGYFKEIKHQLVRFAFRVLSDVHLDGFIQENILYALELSSAEEYAATGRFTVGLDSVMGSQLCGSFSARHGEVLAVTPCTAKGHPVETES